MAFPKTLLPLLLLLALANKVVSQGDATSFTFDSFSTSIDTLIYQGDAFVPSSSSSVRLTKALPSGEPATYSIGRLVYSPAVKMWDEGMQATFETTIKFAITPPSGDNSPGDGFTFFIAPVGSPIPAGSTGGSFGLFNTSGLAPSLFAIEFDITRNSWDPSYSHIGIDINSRTSANVSRFENALGTEVNARINYDSNTRSITVVATYGSGQTSTLSYTFNLKTILPQQVQVGISAATGAFTAFFDLHSWYFSSTLVWDGNSLDKTYISQYV